MMTRDPTDERRPFRSLADIKDAFVDLREVVRDQVAHIVGTAVADAVHRALRTLLDDPPVRFVPVRKAMSYDHWADDDRNGELDRYTIDDDGDTDDNRYSFDDASSASEPCFPDPPVVPRLAVALDAGYRASTWCRSRFTSGWVANIAGAVVTAAAYLAGPVSAAVLPAITALSLADRLCGPA